MNKQEQLNKSVVDNYTIKLKKDVDSSKYYIQENYGINYRYLYRDEIIDFIERENKKGYAVEILPNTLNK